MKLRAYAKLNLDLLVTGRRGDGYHTLSTVMCELPLFDTVRIFIHPAKKDKITVRCSDRSIPQDEKNVAGKAAAAFINGLKEKYDINYSHFVAVYTHFVANKTQKVAVYTRKVAENDRKVAESSTEKYAEKGVNICINIQKRIPHGAGLGGGSADAAAVLKGLNKRFGEVFSLEELLKIGETVGADVPFCIAGGAALCTGTGEKMIPVEKISKCYILLAKPQENLSTAEVFRKYDEMVKPQNKGYTHKNLINALAKRDISGVRYLQNDLYPAAADICPKIEILLSELKKAGALTALMTGSGSAVFGIFTARKTAKKAEKIIQKRGEMIWSTLISTM